jgi:hypothetical protein
MRTGGLVVIASLLLLANAISAKSLNERRHGLAKLAFGVVNDLKEFVSSHSPFEKNTKDFLTCEMELSEYIEKMEAPNAEKVEIESELRVLEASLQQRKLEGANVFDLEGNSFLNKATPELIYDYSILCKKIYKVRPKELIEDSQADLDEAKGILCNGSFKHYNVVRLIYRNVSEEYKEISGAILYYKPENHFIVVFKGSKSIGDWQSNLNFLKTTGDSEFGDGLTMHGGFYYQVKDQLESIQAGIGEVILRLSGLLYTPTPIKVTVAGHSLGGAMASILAYHMRSKVLPKNQYDESNSAVENITFGAPRVYSKASAAQVESAIGKQNIMRVWNSWDPVPAVAPGFLGFKHVGADVKLDSSKMATFGYDAEPDLDVGGGITYGLLTGGPKKGIRNIKKYHVMSTYMPLVKAQFATYRKVMESAVMLTQQIAFYKKSLSKVNKKLAKLGPSKRSCRRVAKRNPEQIRTELAEESKALETFERCPKKLAIYKQAIAKALNNLTVYQAKVSSGFLAKTTKQFWRSIYGQPAKA